jgi:hypothetical protein
LFDFQLRKEYLKNPHAMQQDKEEASNIKEIIMDIFNSLFYYSFTRRKEGWRLIPETESFLTPYKSELNAVKLMRIFYLTLVLSLTSEIKRYLNTKENQVIHLNQFHTLSFINILNTH